MDPAETPEPLGSGLRAFLQRDWARWLSELPETATGVGVRTYDDRWTDDSPEGIEARRRHLETAWTELQAFGDRPLSGTERLDFQLYRDLLRTARAGLVYGHDPMPFRFGSPRSLWMPISQVDGIHLYAADVLMMQPRGTVDDYRILVRRLARLAAAVDQQIGLLREGMKTGWLPPRVPLRELPHQVAALACPEAEQSPIFRPLVEFPASVPEPERRALVEEGRSIYHQQLLPAFERLRRFLEETYLPRCREDVGASGLPHGADWYRFLVEWQTTTSLTPREIHEIGLREVARLRTEMEAVRKQAGFAGTLDEFKELLRTDPRFFPSSANGMLDAYRALAKRIDPELARQFGRLPRLPYGIVAVPEYRAPSSPTAYYISGATATGRAGYFYVNTYDLPARPTWEMEALTLHEAVPGHHLQLALSEEMEDLPEYRRHSGYTAFVEGWGLYAESLGADLGLYQDPYSRFGQLSMDAWRSARLVVDTGMHALGWSRDQAIAYLLEATGKSRVDIVAEVDRYIVWPGQALAYKIGQLKLRETRTKAEQRLGARFDVRAFHDFLLGEGGVPLGRLDERLEQWAPTQG